MFDEALSGLELCVCLCVCVCVYMDVHTHTRVLGQSLHSQHRTRTDLMVSLFLYVAGV